MSFAEIMTAFPEIRQCDVLGRPFDGKPYEDEKARDKHRDYSILGRDLDIWRSVGEKIFTFEFPNVMYFATGLRADARFYFIERRIDMAVHGFTHVGVY